MYNYKAKINRVIDGDTVNLTIDLGFRLTYTANCRLAGINAPEMKGITMAKGMAAKDYLEDLLGFAECTIDSKELDKYGRPVVVIWANGINVNIKMVTDGMAEKY